MNPNYIKPIPKRIERQILNYDAQHNTYTGLRFYAYLTTIQKELVKVTVAIRNKGKKTRLIKQVAIHGVFSDKCLVKDMEYSFMGNYRVGWYDEGIKYPYNIRPFYNDGIWYAVDFKYFNPWTHVINPQFALSLSQFRYSAVNIQNPPCIITYLRTYLKYPQAEYLVKAGLGKYVGSTMILKKIGSDKGFRKWLMAHREELRAHHYYVDVVLRAYRTGKPLELLQSYREAKINLRNNNMLTPIRELFTGIERERFFDYISEQDTNVNTYLDYLKACQYLGLDSVVYIVARRHIKIAPLVTSAHYPADFFHPALRTFEFQHAVLVAETYKHFPAAAAYPLGRLRCPLTDHFPARLPSIHFDTTDQYALYLAILHDDILHLPVLGVKHDFSVPVK